MVLNIWSVKQKFFLEKLNGLYSDICCNDEDDYDDDGGDDD